MLCTFFFFFQGGGFIVWRGIRSAGEDGGGSFFLSTFVSFFPFYFR